MNTPGTYEIFRTHDRLGGRSLTLETATTARDAYGKAAALGGGIRHVASGATCAGPSPDVWSDVDGLEVAAGLEGLH